MYWWKLAGRRGALVFITVILVTSTVSHLLPNEPTTWPPEHNCIEGAAMANICACDPQCARYGDCCRSSPYFVPEEKRLGTSPFTCTNLIGNKMYVMTTCPPDWKDSDTRNRCEHPDGSYRDPLLDAPVTSLSTNITYQNWHCAFCHGDLEAATTVIWIARFTCPWFHITTSLSDETLAEHISFNPLTSSWNLNISVPASDTKSSMSPPGYIQRSKNNNNQEIQSNCFLTFTAPVTELPARWCNNDVISRCSESWKDNEVKTQCEAYTAHVCSGYKLYRNYHCLLCNDLVFPEPCPGHVRPPVVRPFVVRPFEEGSRPSLTVLLDWRRLKRGMCASSEVYDPLSLVCREVFI